MKRSTLKDIAKLTGLSVSGVSRALKDHPDIAPETKDKVREVANALNYHPNPSAQFLHSKNSKIIAAILPEVNTFFFPEILQGISKVVESMQERKGILNHTEGTEFTEKPRGPSFCALCDSAFLTCGCRRRPRAFP